MDTLGLGASGSSEGAGDVDLPGGWSVWFGLCLWCWFEDVVAAESLGPCARTLSDFLILVI